MGIKLIKEVIVRYPDLPLAEWKALIVLAEDANDATRVTWNAVTSEKITVRIGLAPHAWANLRGKLVRKGLLEVVEAGRKGRCAKYRFPVLPPIHPHLEDEPEIRPQEEDESNMGPHAEDESERFRPQGEDVSAKYVLQEVTPTPPSYPSDQNPPPPASSPWSATEREAEAEPEAKQDPELQARAEAFADKLPYDRRPSRSEQVELIRLAVLALAAGWSEDDLLSECERALDGVRNRIGLWIKTRLKPEELGVPSKVKFAPPAANGMRPKCWRCDWNRTLRSDQGSCDCPFCSLPAGASSAEEEALWMKAQTIGIEKAGVYRADGTFMRWPPAPVPKPRASNEHHGWRQEENPVYGRPTRPSRGSYQNPTDNGGYRGPL